MKKRASFTKLDRSTSIRLGVCAAALGGTASAVPDAQAQVVTFNTPIPLPQTVAGVYINLLTGATGSSGALAGWDFNPYVANTGANLGFYWGGAGTEASGVASTTSGPYLDLSFGTVVGPGSTFTAAINGTVGSPFVTTGTHILGFQFLNESTAQMDFGYMTMTTTAGAPGGYPATIQSWSFESSGGPITVTGVPEPSTMLLTGAAMALGARGMRRWRRRGAAA